MKNISIKKYKQVFAGLLCFALLHPPALMATSLDLSGFSVSENVTGSVTESGGTIIFNENDYDIALYFFNDFFLVPANATLLSFDYTFQNGYLDTDDYLQFNVDFSEQKHLTSNGGHIAFDMSPYQGNQISLDWALIEGGDDFGLGSPDWFGATARIYNIDLVFPAQTTSQVPEPATMLLLGTGLIGLFVAGRRKKPDNAI